MHFKTYLNETRDTTLALKRKEQALAILNKVKSGSTIYNPDYKEMKSYMDRYIEEYYNYLKEEYFFPIMQKRDLVIVDPEDVTALEMYVFPSTSNFESSLKKIEKLKDSKKYKAFYDEAKKFFTENMPLVKEILSWKDKIVKRVPGEKKAKKTEEVKRILTSNKEVKDVVTLIANEFRPQLERDYIEYKNNVIDKNSKDGIVKFAPRERGKDDKATELRMLLMPYMETITYPTEFKLKSNYKKIIVKESKENADAIIQEFIEKVTLKLNTILTKKGNLQNVKKEGNSPKTNEIYMEFADGSKFKMRNQIVYGYSMYQRLFVRYPSTFHDVILPGGKKMAQPSEAAMIKTFAEAK